MKNFILLFTSLMLFTSFAFSQGKGTKLKLKSLEVTESIMLSGSTLIPFTIDTTSVVPANGAYTYLYLNGVTSETNIYAKEFGDSLNGIFFQITEDNDQAYSYTIYDNDDWENDSIIMDLPCDASGNSLLSVQDFTDSVNTKSYFSDIFNVVYQGSGDPANDTVTASFQWFNYGSPFSCISYPDNTFYINNNFLYFKRNGKWYRSQIATSW